MTHSCKFCQVASYTPYKQIDENYQYGFSVETRDLRWVNRIPGPINKTFLIIDYVGELVKF